jgi:predicted acetyltransferase
MPELVAPDVRYRRSFGAAMAEFQAEGRGGPEDGSVIGWYIGLPGPVWVDDVAFAAFAAIVKAEALETTELPPGIVPNTELWWVEGEDFLGRIGIRHRLTPRLLELGGHIGYDVRPSARRRGHATEMLRRALGVAAGLGIERGLITCHVDNVGSRTVIERNGGLLEDQRGHALRFWAPTG